MCFLIVAATILVILCLLSLFFGSVRWDKIPIIGYFVLEIELWPSAFDASYLEKPITWEQLDEEPIDWDEHGTGSWFSFNAYTKNLLKKYMKENNLGIVPSNWPNFKFTANFEDCLECFEFVELDNSTIVESEN